MRKAPNTKEIADNHKFQINPNYTNIRSIIYVPILSIKSKKNIDRVQIDETILRRRRNRIDLAIGRIMHARKTLKHNELVTEVVKQLIGRFTPKPVDIKKRIANLIEMEYLERDENERGLYHYLRCPIVYPSVDRFKVPPGGYETVKQLKLWLQEQEEIPTEQLRLIYKGKLMNDVDLLSERGISVGDTVHVSVMLRGS
eukprot:341269_1